MKNPDVFTSFRRQHLRKWTEVHCSSQVFLSGQILGQQINDFTLPDVNLIAEHSDAAELGDRKSVV